MLTVLNILSAPGMCLYPHEHRMWAVIGIYSGREDNILLQARKRTDGARRKDTGRQRNLPLGEAVIHAVTNTLDRTTAAIHVYGGDFFAVPRSQWDPQTFEERPFDVERANRVFEEANRRLAAGKAATLRVSSS